MALAQFPADRRIAEIRRCAEVLQKVHGEEANQFWRSTMRDFAANLVRQGAEPEEVSHQAALFMAAVQNELQAMFAQEEEQALA